MFAEGPVGRRGILALRFVLAVALAGSVAVQVIVVSLLWSDEKQPSATVRISAVVVVLLGIACLQVVAVCIWRLLTMVRRGTVFSVASFRYVDITIGAVALASVLVLAVAVIARFANHQVPEDEVAPGVVALICGLSLVVAGVALVVYVLRVLLVQAVALDTAARHLQSELDEVI